jgi:hypothetical protein
VGRDVAIIVQGHHNVSLDLLPSATLNSLLDTQIEVLLDADVNAYPDIGRMDDRYLHWCFHLARLSPNQDHVLTFR